MRADEVQNILLYEIVQPVLCESRKHFRENSEEQALWVEAELERIGKKLRELLR